MVILRGKVAGLFVSTAVTDIQQHCLIAQGWSQEDFGLLRRKMEWYRADGKSLGLLPTDDHHIQRYTDRGFRLPPPLVRPSVRRFLENCCTLRPDAEYKALHLWYCYKAWAAKVGVEPVDRHDFTKGIASLEGVSRKRNRARLWKGISVVHVPEGALDRPRADVKANSSTGADSGYDGKNTLPGTRHLAQSSFPMTPDLSELPEGQRRAIEALIGDSEGRTYTYAAKIAGMAEGTLLTHINRVRQNHPDLYAEIRDVRLAQLAVRHRFALQHSLAHSRRYFWRRARNRRLYGY